MDERIITTPAEFIELQKECLVKVRFYVDLANQKLDLCLKYPQVKFSLRGTTAGKADIGANELLFSPTLLRENPDHFIQQTVGHEVAHLISHLKWGWDIDPHGIEWKRVMWAFDLPALRCHSYDTSNVPTRATSIRRRPRPAGMFDGGTIRELD